MSTIIVPEFRRLLLARADDKDVGEVFESEFDSVNLACRAMEDMTALDTVIFGGGTDINPHLYSEGKHPFTQDSDMVRDNWERKMFRRAQAVGASCIGICRGAQLLCALSGGKLIQHVTGHSFNSHGILTDDGRVFIASADHHQLMYPYDTFYHLVAWAGDVGDSHCEYGKQAEDLRDPEIVWFPDTRSLAIQPHPEWMMGSAPFVKYCIELVRRYIPNNATLLNEEHHAR